jgi:hypothetical protein
VRERKIIKTVVSVIVLPGGVDRKQHIRGDLSSLAQEAIVNRRPGDKEREEEEHKGDHTAPPVINVQLWLDRLNEQLFFAAEVTKERIRRLHARLLLQEPVQRVFIKVIADHKQVKVRSV